MTPTTQLAGDSPEPAPSRLQMLLELLAFARQQEIGTVVLIFDDNKQSRSMAVRAETLTPGDVLWMKKHMEKKD